MTKGVVCDVSAPKARSEDDAAPNEYMAPALADPVPALKVVRFEDQPASVKSLLVPELANPSKFCSYTCEGELNIT